MKYRLVCPRCNKESETVSDRSPHVNCGDCLMNDVEIVEMTPLPIAGPPSQIMKGVSLKC